MSNLLVLKNLQAVSNLLHPAWTCVQQQDSSLKECQLLIGKNWQLPFTDWMGALFGLGALAAGQMFVQMCFAIPLPRCAFFTMYLN